MSGKGHRRERDGDDVDGERVVEVLVSASEHGRR
jgi:hypothetical protein